MSHGFRSPNKDDKYMAHCRQWLVPPDHRLRNITDEIAISKADPMDYNLAGRFHMTKP
jgi:hypothetical protein